MNSNLQTASPTSASPTPSTSNLGYKHILLRKLSYAVTCSVISQLVILLWFIFVLNFSLLSPVASIGTYIKTLTTVSTWVYVFMFSTIVFAQSIICAKDYIITPCYCSTRFSKLKAIFSIHNLILLNLHMFVGFVCVWLFLGFTSFGLLDHRKDKYFIVENTLYLLYVGAWIGFYYFISVYTSEKKVLFPVIQQIKWLQFKAHLLPLLKKSKKASFWPTAYFVILYAVFGHWLNAFLPIEIQQQSNDIRVYLFAWFFATLIYFSLNLMNFYYGLFLTEPFEFPIIAMTDDAFTLKDALESNVPIIQHLACQDVFLLSGNSKDRREILFTLSNPGNHPHNWNNVIQILLKIVKDYTDCLNNSLNNIFLSDKPKIVEVSPTKPEHYINPKVRRMGLLASPECVGVVQITNSNYFNYVTSTPNNIVANLSGKFDRLVGSLKEKLGINFLFKELPEASIQKCLGEGQMIVWVVQAMSCLCLSSLMEDRYGIAQKDLPVIINTLVELKLSVEKLNRLPALNRKGPGMDDYNCKMKLGITNAAKRSIYNIVSMFGPYLKDLNLKNDIFVHLQAFAPVKNGHCY